MKTTDKKTKHSPIAYILINLFFLFSLRHSFGDSNEQSSFFVFCFYIFFGLHILTAIIALTTKNIQSTLKNKHWLYIVADILIDSFVTFSLIVYNEHLLSSIYMVAAIIPLFLSIKLKSSLKKEPV
jgi:glucan phosphoethanolaminetransferase (alkaline phosphatase superfamily)